MAVMLNNDSSPTAEQIEAALAAFESATWQRHAGEDYDAFRRRRMGAALVAAALARFPGATIVDIRPAPGVTQP